MGDDIEKGAGKFGFWGDIFGGLGGGCGGWGGGGGGVGGGGRGGGGRCLLFGLVWRHSVSVGLFASFHNNPQEVIALWFQRLTLKRLVGCFFIILDGVVIVPRQQGFG